jgi:hypothetical protein
MVSRLKTTPAVRSEVRWSWIFCRISGYGSYKLVSRCPPRTLKKNLPRPRTECFDHQVRCHGRQHSLARFPSTSTSFCCWRPEPSTAQSPAPSTCKSPSRSPCVAPSRSPEASRAYGREARQLGSATRVTGGISWCALRRVSSSSAFDPSSSFAFFRPP